MKSIQIVSSFVRDHAEICVFFFFLATSLFLGDGKQPFVDAWWALGILMMYGVRYYQHGKLDLRSLPRAVGWAWAAILLYYVILTPFSDSAGYSITATIRLIEAYLAYLLFYTISSKRVIPLFTKGLLFVGVIATLASFIFFLSPSLAGFLPPMNLLYATYGHNHLADLLLMIFPIVITQSYWLLLIFFTTAMFFTFARGVWLLLIFYLLFLVWKSKNIIMRRVSLFIAAVTVGAFLLVSLRGIPTQKPSLLEDGRWEYWRQAIEAIKERPFFGSGPGTFYLQSRRLQIRPSSYSWFAHSYFLQSLVELGLVGTTALFLLFYYHIKIFWRRIKIYKYVDHNFFYKSFLWGLILTIIYSQFEYNLDYLVVWLLFFAICGLLAGSTTVIKGKTHDWTKGVCLGLTVLTIYYVLSLSGLVTSTLFQNVNASFFLAPYDANLTISYLKTGQVLGNKDGKLIRLFHKQNPEVVYALAQNNQTNLKYDIARRLYASALYLDPLNLDYNRQYLSLVSQHLITDETEQKRVMFLLNNVSQNSWFLPVRLYKYAIVDFLSGQKDLTSKLLEAAIYLDPGSSFWRVELANYYLNINEKNEANKTLTQCLKIPAPRKHCQDYIKYNLDHGIVEPVGFLENTIDQYYLMQRRL